MNLRFVLVVLLVLVLDWWFVFEDEDEREDEWVHGPDAFEKRKGALSFHEPTRPSNRSLLWESGAKDARTPDASRPPDVSEPREAFGVRPIYRRFPSGAAGQVAQALLPHPLNSPLRLRGAP